MCFYCEIDHFIIKCILLNIWVYVILYLQNDGGFVMNSNWRNRPTTLEEAPRTIDWIVAIDESGTPDLKYIEKSLKNNKIINAGDTQFTVTACAIRTENFDSSKEKVMQIKNKYWENAFYKYKDGEKRVCFHSKEIRSKAQAFNPNLINYSEFISDLSAMMSDLPMKLLSANIDKKGILKNISIQLIRMIYV